MSASAHASRMNVEARLCLGECCRILPVALFAAGAKVCKECRKRAAAKGKKP